ncbi:Protein flp [Daldinia childiae]|uniref:Protein flp n=1 Tax=Daldinia childiae TaxID=326645 RepID=UPI00144801FC|nr:Protein flp [Daldinia childiae]KAF3064577.1 Protein flp [Daldinia childiae]
MILETLTAVFLGTSILAASTARNRVRNAEAKIDKICEASGVPGASIGVIHHGKTIHTYNYGYSDSKKRIPTNPGTVYGIGSITKSFIAVAIAQLVDENKLTWDTPVKEILPEFNHDNPFITEMMTITDILSHRCGLSGGGAMNLVFEGDGDALLSKDELFELVNHFPILSPFRQSWNYFVWGYSMAGAIIEKVAEKPLKDYLFDNIFQPLGMKVTSLSPNYRNQGELAEPFAGLSNGSAFHLHKLQVFEGTFFEASGGIYSSLDDLMTWASAILNSTIGKTPTNSSVIKGLPYILSNHIAIENPSITERSYGLGWVRTQLPGVVGLIGDNSDLWDIDESPVLGVKDKPLLMIYHQGSTVGYYSFVALFPDTNSAVVVLTNSIGLSDAADWIARVVIQALFDFDDGQDYVALADEANNRTLAQYKQLDDKIAEMRTACSNSKSLASGSFVGRYRNKSKLFFIDILVQADQSDRLYLRFQGLEDQTYELRRLCGNIFEWSLTHDETMKRGRYNNSEPSFFLFKFILSDDGEVISFSWANNLELPDLEEIFEKDKKHIIGEDGQREQKPIP